MDLELCVTYCRSSYGKLSVGFPGTVCNLIAGQQKEIGLIIRDIRQTSALASS